METQNSNPAPSAPAAVDTTTTTGDAATKNGGNATQEVSSTTQAVEVTKRSLRVEVWKRMQELKLGNRFRVAFNSIPKFVDSEKALQLLVETEEFKKANDIKVQIDRALHGAKMQTILAGKNLYLPSKIKSSALYLKVDVPAEANEKEKLDVLNAQNMEKHRTEIDIDHKVVPLDMVIIGAVLVSRDGYCIGRGNGFNDLDIALLTEVGSITPNTVIATLVHDSQVVDSLPTNLFQIYDAPVDLIVTPTEVIRCTKRPPRPTQIYWHLLSERRLKLIGALQVLKEKLEKEGKIITLKEEDTDVEQFKQKSRNRRRFMLRRRVGGRRFQRRTVSQTNNNNDQQDENNEDQSQKRNVSRRRRFPNRRRRTTKSEGDQSGAESKSQDRKASGKRRPRFNQRVPNKRSFSVKLTNITREMRIKDLKSELRSRNCNPMGITWKGNAGHCYLHFGKRSGEQSTETEMNQVLEALNNLSLTITPEPHNDAKGNTESTTNGAANAGGDQRNASEEAVKTPIVVNLKAELIKFADRANRGASNAASDVAVPAATVNGGDPAAGGDASSARIESVDTTTV